MSTRDAERLADILEAIGVIRGRAAALGLSVRDLEGLEETLALLSDPAAMRRIRKARAEILAGQAEELTKEQARALLQRR